MSVLQIFNIKNYLVFYLYKYIIIIKNQTPWITQDIKIRKTIKILIATAPIIIEEKVKKDPWYITYWPIIAGIVVLVGAGLCYYYFSPESPGPDNSNRLGETVLNNDTSSLGETVLNNDTSSLGETVLNNDTINLYPGTNSDININGVLYHLNTRLDLTSIFPHWGGTEEEILALLGKSKAEIIDFIAHYSATEPEVFRNIVNSPQLEYEVYLALKEAIDLYFT